MLFSFLITAGLLSASRPDVSETMVLDSLMPVTVTADKGVVVSRTDTLSLNNSFTVSEVLHQSPGLYVGDYGGLAGLKTVNLRGLGSPHTSLYIDGVRVGNVQSGQNDLGMLGIENYGSVVVDYAQNSVSFNTSRPVFGSRAVAGDVRLSGGSFGTWLPYARLDFRLSDRLALSATAAGAVSKGDFRYGDDSRRANNDMSQVRGGIDLFGMMDNGDYHVKAYVNSAERGTPGSLDWPSEDRQKDMNAFVQGVFRNRFSPLYSLHMSAKTSYDDIYYTSSWGDSRYGQTEVQVNTSHIFDIFSWWKVSFAADLQWDGLKSTVYDASRLTAFSAVTTSFRLERFTADLSLEYIGAFDRDAQSRNALSPSLDLRVRLIDGLDAVAFGRRAYRVPTFNELYYVGYGNPDLKPEDAWLTDLGLDYNKRISQAWVLKAKLNGFFNYLTDKITSAPSADNPNVWLPYNIGKVRSAGLDALAGFVYGSGDWIASFEARYSYQSAIDRTPDSYTFGQQIPYVSRHSVVLDARVSWKGYEFAPRWLLRSGRRDSMGEMPSWNTLDLNLNKKFDLKNDLALKVMLNVRNLMDCRYELVSGYPMPGRSFMAGVAFTF